MKKMIRFAWRGKLIAIMLSVVIIVLMIMTWLNMKLSVQTITEREMAYNNTYVVNILHSVDNILKDMSRVSLMMFSDPKSMSIIKSYRTTDVITQANNVLYFDTLFNNLITIREEIDKIHIFDLYGLIYNLDMRRITDTKSIVLTEEPWYEILNSGNGSLKRIKGCIILGARFPDYFRKANYLNVFQQYHFSVVREIKTFSPHETIGYIEVMAPVSVLQNLVKDSKTESSVVLIDQFMNIVYEKTGEYLGVQISEAFPELSGVILSGEKHARINVDGVESLITVQQSDISGWTIVSIVPVSVVQQSALKLRNIVFWLSLVVLAIVIPTVILFARKLSKPIIALSDGMRRVRKGEDNVALPIVNNDEIGWLTEQFNRMISETREANQTRYEAIKKLHRMELLQKETELMYLRNQINPHFLYNILDSIRMTAALNGDNEVADIILNLANFFRMSVSKGSCFIPLGQEISMIKSYMSLMKLRYKSIKDEYDIDETLLDMHILNFILQPVVENAIIHGLKEMGYKGTIRISAHRIPETENDFMISIADTGISMSDEKMSLINMRLKNCDNEDEKSNQTSSIGLINVQRRLRMFMPENYGISICRNPGGGTIVNIKLKEIYEEE